MNKMLTTRTVETEFLPDYDYALRGEVNRFAYIMTLCVAAFVVIFLVWAKFAVLDEVTRGEAQVIPSQKVQVVQNLEGGILADLLVHNGEIVQKGDVLLRIANTGAEAEYRDAHSQSQTLKAMIARLAAESYDKPLVFPADLAKEAPETVASEQALYMSQMNQVKTQVDVMRDQLTQRQQDIAALLSRQQSVARQLELAREERQMTAPLVATGAAAKLDLVKIDRQVSDLQGQLAQTRDDIPRAQAARDEVNRRIQERAATFHSDARAELNKDVAGLAQVTQKAFADHDKVTRTEVRSPVRGTIKDVKINTIGAVIQPGQDLVEIVPLEDTLLIQAKVRPSDVAFLHPGEDATVKITAYDYAIYGGLKAKLEQISADTIKDEHGDTFFRVMLRTDKNSLGTAAHPLPIIPGMTATVQIKTGQRSVLDYLLKPIFDARDKALTER